MANAISVSGLVKTFASVRALDGLDLTVATGEVHGFLGPNGAGKSTTIRVLLGLLRADAAEARLLGADPWTDAVALHRRLAYVPGDVSLWPGLSGGEAIDLLGRLRGGLNPTVLLSSHILAEVEALCDRVTIIRAGRTVESGSLGDLRHLTHTSIAVETAEPPAGLAALPGVHALRVEGHRARFDVDTSHLDDALSHLTRFGIRSLTSQPPTLEELFLRHYGDELAEAA